MYFCPGLNFSSGFLPSYARLTFVFKSAFMTDGSLPLPIIPAICAYERPSTRYRRLISWNSFPLQPDLLPIVFYCFHRLVFQTVELSFFPGEPSFERGWTMLCSIGLEGDAGVDLWVSLIRHCLFLGHVWSSDRKADGSTKCKANNVECADGIG